MTSDFVIALGAVVSAVATIFIAIYNWKSHVLAIQMRDIAKNTIELTKEMNKKNILEKENTNKIFWAIVISNALTDLNSSLLKTRFGLLINIFGYEKMKKEIGFEDKAFIEIGTKDLSKCFDEVIKKYYKPDDK